MTEMILALTGHRPERLGNLDALRAKTTRALRELQPTTVITGMASGFDLIGGGIALDLEIPIVCAKPWKGHKPRKADEEEYLRLIKYADEVVNVIDSESFPGNWCYHKRNEWMVDHSDRVLACLAEDATRGGTFATVKYARSKNVPIRILSPK